MSLLPSYTRPCDRCGVELETGGDFPRSRPRYCQDCMKARKREYAKNLYHANTQHAQPAEFARLPVRVLDISPAVTDSEWRWYLSGYRNSTLPWWDFKESLPDGSFDGLVIERGGQQYEVVNGSLVQPGDYRQAALLEVGR